jgi:hypothetical protein
VVHVQLVPRKHVFVHVRQSYTDDVRRVQEVHVRSEAAAARSRAARIQAPTHTVRWLWLPVQCVYCEKWILLQV